MIVLAIAGLIMVVVFLAIPQLQRSQRNNAREAVMNRVAAEVNNYASNNSGAIPTMNNNATTGFVGTTGGFYVRYINSNASSFTDPSTGSTMTFVAWTADNAVTTSSTVYYASGRSCSGEASVAASGRNFVIMTQLEGGAIYCLDNR